MKFIIKPYESVGMIKFGDARTQVRRFLGKKCHTGKIRCSDPKYPTDYYTQFNLFIYYKAPGVVDSFEFSREANIEFLGINPLHMKPDQLLSFLKERDSHTETDNEGFTSKALGAAFYIPLDEIESAFFFERNYYE